MVGGLGRRDDWTSRLRASNNTSDSSAGHTIIVSSSVKHSGAVEGHFVSQVCLLQRVSRIVRPVTLLMALSRIYLGSSDNTTIRIDVEVDREPNSNAGYEWDSEKETFRSHCWRVVLC